MTITPIGIYFLYFALYNPESHLCTNDDRSTSCNSINSQPICAVYTSDECSSSSATGFCQKTLDDSCLACADPSIISYTPGECQQPKNPQVCSENAEKVACNEENGLVCGYSPASMLTGQNIKAGTWTSTCNACNQNIVAFTVQGGCQEPISLGICQEEHREVNNCPLSEIPTCAYYTGEDCTEQICKKTVANPCSACFDSDVLFYVPGACETSNELSLADKIMIEPPKVFAKPPPVEYDSDDSNAGQPDTNMIFLTNSESIVNYEDTPISNYDDDYLDLSGDEPDRHGAPIPELEAVIQADGSVLYEPVALFNSEFGEETFGEYDVGILYDKVEPDVDYPELEAVKQPDGSVIYEVVKPSREVPKAKTRLRQPSEAIAYQMIDKRD